MPSLEVGNRPFTAEHVGKVFRGSEKAALESARKNHRNDIAFTMGRDTFIATGTSRVTNVAVGDPVLYQGQRGTVTAVDDDAARAERSKRNMEIAGGTALAGSAAAIAAAPLSALFVVPALSLGAAYAGILHFRAEGFNKEVHDHMVREDAE